MNFLIPRMTGTDRTIKNIEKKWLSLLFNACRNQFNDVHLPSHDHLHHLRVWQQAKMLLLQLAKKHVKFGEKDVELLMIAVFFHDQGMSLSVSREHGKLSRQLCKAFLSGYPDFTNAATELILDAVEHHDKKEYANTEQLHDPLDIRQILNIADDLDAFGFNGTYRYLEIYLMRGTALTDLHDAIVPNVTGRYQHFAKVFATYQSLTKSQQLRFAATRNFFKDLNLQLKQLQNGAHPDTGPSLVVNLIHSEILVKKSSIPALCEKVLATDNDFYVTHFFRRFKAETEPITD